MDAPINHIGHQRVWAYNDVKDILNTLEVEEVKEPTDAFIEKAAEWLKKNIEDYMYVLYDTDGRPTNNVKVAKLCFEDFKNYMKGDKL